MVIDMPKLLQTAMSKKIILLVLLLGASNAIAPVQARDMPCGNAAQYVMPEGVELGDDDSAGGVPADVAPSPIEKALPQTYRFPLAIDPLPDVLPNASIDLGDVGIDSKTGEATLNGQPLSSNDAADAQAGCVEAEKRQTR